MAKIKQSALGQHYILAIKTLIIRTFDIIITKINFWH